MAQFMKLLVTIALTFAITIAIITTRTINTNTTTETFALKDLSKDLTPPREVKIRPSRFLAQKSDEGQGPRARKRNTDCNKEPKICSRTGAANATMACCNNKCIDLLTDTKNCGACQKKCWFGQTCCGGECADMDFSKRHCGKCNNRCKPGVFCVLGMCNYA